jgi:hypothetical protein
MLTLPDDGLQCLRSARALACWLRRPRADMILIDGDPTKNIRDLDKITTVIKGGNIYDPAAIEKALGISPRK